MLPRRRQSLNIWPGFVDGLASVLLVLLFTLMIFVAAQFFLSYIASNREGALKQLSANVHELLDELSIEQKKVGSLEDELADALGLARETDERLGAMLARAESAERDRDAATAEQNRLSAARDELSAQRDALLDARASFALERDTVAAERDALLAERDALRALLDDATVKDAAANAALDAERQTLLELRDELRFSEDSVKARLSEIAGLQADISALREVRAALEARVGELETGLTERDDSLTVARDRAKALDASLASLQERTRLSQSEIEARDRRIQDLATQIAENNAALEGEKTLTDDERNRVRTLETQVESLLDEISRLNSALAFSKDDVTDARAEATEALAQVSDLGEKLNRALAERVEELQRYRSDFFGRLSEVLGGRADVQVVGDRFLFQSELLFASGSAELEPAGEEQVRSLASTLKSVAEDIPADVDWLLRVDGHTDRVPINSLEFPSNWELSAARALSVVRFLVAEGIPARRLAAAGFGEFRPLDSGRTAEALARNRRIEIKLTGP